jgi:hypothetical protein
MYSDPRSSFKLGEFIQSVEDKLIYSKPKVADLVRELQRLNEMLEEEDREIPNSWIDYLKQNYGSLEELDPDDRKALVQDLEGIKQSIMNKIK